MANDAGKILPAEQVRHVYKFSDPLRELNAGDGTLFTDLDSHMLSLGRYGNGFYGRTNNGLVGSGVNAYMP